MAVGPHRFRRRLRLVTAAVAVPVLLASYAGAQGAVGAAPPPHAAPPAPSTPVPYHPSAAYRWLGVALEATAREVERHGPRPTVVSRTLAIAVTAMYDAWAPYDKKAVGTRLGRKLRRPPRERTEANKEKAIAYAAYRALLDVYPDDAVWLADQMRQRGFDPGDTSTDTRTPQGIGNVAAAAVVAYRHHDGANQLGDERAPAARRTPTTPATSRSTPQTRSSTRTAGSRSRSRLPAGARSPRASSPRSGTW